MLINGIHPDTPTGNGGHDDRERDDHGQAAATTVTTGSARLTHPAAADPHPGILADVLDLMDSTITNIAAPTIVRDIGGGESLIKWLGASYALAMGVLLVVGGRLGDRYGKRRMFLIGIAGFTVASLAARPRVDPAVLIVARLVQGGFGALLIPQGIGILIGTFNREQMRTAFSSVRAGVGARPSSARSWPGSSSAPTSAG